MNLGPDYDRDREGARAVPGEGSGDPHHGAAQAPAQNADTREVDVMALHRLLVQFRRCIDHLEHHEDRPDPVAAAQFWEDYVDEWQALHFDGGRDGD